MTHLARALRRARRRRLLRASATRSPAVDLRAHVRSVERVIRR